MEQAIDQFRDKLLPDQPILRDYFDGDEADFAAAMYDSLITFGGIQLPMKQFDLLEVQDFPLASMVSNLSLLELIRLLIFMKRPARILEIGTFVGVSAMYMAAALPAEGRVVTIEKFDVFANVARQNFVRNHLDHKINLICGDAFEELKKGDFFQNFDLIFLDGNKEKYADYFALLDPLLKPNGLMIVDDIFFQGDVLNHVPKTEKGLGARRFLEETASNTNYHKAILPLGDGVAIMLKKE